MLQSLSDREITRRTFWWRFHHKKLHEVIMPTIFYGIYTSFNIYGILKKLYAMHEKFPYMFNSIFGFQSITCNMNFKK